VSGIRNFGQRNLPISCDSFSAGLRLTSGFGVAGVFCRGWAL